MKPPRSRSCSPWTTTRRRRAPPRNWFVRLAIRCVRSTRRASFSTSWTASTPSRSAASCSTCGCRAWTASNCTSGSSSATCALPVIIVTGYADTALTVRALRSGVLAVLDKPCRDDELWSFIQEGLPRATRKCAARRHRRSLEERFRRLSPQDRQVLQLILEGLQEPHDGQAARREPADGREPPPPRVRRDAGRVGGRADADGDGVRAPPGARARPAAEAWLALPFERVA